MLDRLGGFYSHVMTDIQTLVDAYYVFYRRPDTSSYIADSPYKDKFLYDNIENVSNGKPCCRKGCLWANETIHIYKFEGDF